MKLTVSILKKRISNCLITTAVALIVLSIVALFYHGTMICISTIFETFLLSIVLQILLEVLSSLEIKNMYLEILCKYATVIGLTIAFGYFCNWIQSLPGYVLIPMAAFIYFLCCRMEVNKTKADIDEINQKIVGE